MEFVQKIESLTNQCKIKCLELSKNLIIIKFKTNFVNSKFQTFFGLILILLILKLVISTQRENEIQKLLYTKYMLQYYKTVPIKYFFEIPIEIFKFHINNDQWLGILDGHIRNPIKKMNFCILWYMGSSMLNLWMQ